MNVLKDLNTEQKTAVKTTEGPVLIVAGAGTGKTRVITTRIAHLLASKKDLRPENILALTFTDKATNEMRERVSGAIKKGADDVWIYTFHSFCRKILSDDGSHIGISSNFNILNDVEKWIFLKKLLPKFRLDYYLHLADPASVISSFTKFISRAKDELVLPGEYAAYVEGLKDKFQKAKGKLSPEEKKARELELKREAEVARIYDVYQKETTKKNILDFGDLILFTIKLFNQRPNVLSAYRGQFRYILVDEFQDTNIAQIELLNILAGKRRNICVVGDDDQAIYRFRGASYASFLKFKEKYPGLTSVKLTQNYRSTEKILNSADRLITNNGPDRYDPAKKLWTKNQKGKKVHAIVACDYQEEARAVADKIETIYAEAAEKNYSDMAVLYRAHSHKNILLNELKTRGIPAAVIRGANLFEAEEIRDLISYMKLVNDPRDSVNLFRVLTSHAWNADIEDLIRLASAAKKEETSIYEIISALDSLKGIGSSTKKALKIFKEHLKGLLRVSKREDVVEFFRTLLLESKYLNAFIKKGSVENEQKVLNVSTFYNFIVRYIKNNSDRTLAGFLEYLDCFIEAGGSPGQQDLVGSENAVQFMTVHAAKGLEFPYVFLISMVRNRFPTMKRKEPIPFPDSLMKERLPEGDFHREEERRLCYVAMTRAQKGLYTSSINTRTSKPSVFIKEVFTEDAMDSGDVDYTEISPEEEVSGKVSAFLDKFKEMEKAKGLTHKLPKPAKISFSQIGTYRKCPMQYKFAYIYRIPGRKRAALTFGTVVHSALEDFFKMVQERKAVDENTLLDLYKNYWMPTGYESKMQESAYKKSGQASLKTFFKNNKEILSRPPLYLEKKLDLKIGGSVVDVRIDRIDKIGKTDVEIIDYKTGKASDKRAAEKSLQLDIYAIATKEVLGLNPKLLSFYYIGPNQKITTTRTAEQLEEAKGVVLETAELINSEEFEPAPGRICKWCDYFSLCPAHDKK